MPVTAYQRGYKRERWVRAQFEAAGFAVMSSRGSHGPADLIAWDANGYHMVQVKTASSLPRRQRDVIFESMRDYPVPPNTVLEIWGLRKVKGRWTAMIWHEGEPGEP